MLVIDLLAVLPWYLPLLGVDLRVLRTLRLLRIFRIAKLGRYSRALQTIGSMITECRFELGMTIMIGFVMLLIASTGMYYAEHEAQPEAFSSIPQATWWAVMTLTTVGYGDVSPTTTLGKIMGACVATLGIGLFALPTSILAGAFMDALKRRREEPASEDAARSD